MIKELSEIKGFESCANYVLYSDGRVYSRYKEDFLEPLPDSKGYQCIDIRSTNSILRYPKIHRLMMLAFSKESPKEQINHIDGNKKNNNIENLEYASNRENREHAIKTGLKDEIGYGIAQYDLDMNLLDVYDTASEAIDVLGIHNGNPGNIGRAIRGSRKTAYGYIWKQYEGSTTIER